MERVDMHRLQELVRLHRQGRSVREVARLLGMSPNTERGYRRALRSAGLLEGEVEDLPELSELREAALERLPPRRPPQQVSSVAHLAVRVFEMAARGSGPKAIYDVLVLEDPAFQGSYAAVKRLWRQWKKERGVQPQDVAIPVETAAGEVAQVDFGYVGMLVDPRTHKRRRAWVFVMVLAHSRPMFTKIVFDQRTQTWLQLHVEAFTELGGVVATVVPDNLKAAMIRAAFGVERDDNGLNRSYRELARHYGFTVDPAPPRAPKKKGKVESGVRYVKRSFFQPRALEDADEAQQELRRWRFEIAPPRPIVSTPGAVVRVHSTAPRPGREEPSTGPPEGRTVHVPPVARRPAPVGFTPASLFVRRAAAGPPGYDLPGTDAREDPMRGASILIAIPWLAACNTPQCGSTQGFVSGTVTGGVAPVTVAATLDGADVTEATVSGDGTYEINVEGGETYTFAAHDAGGCPSDEVTQQVDACEEYTVDLTVADCQ